MAWIPIISGMSAWFESKNASDEDATAKHIADLYKSAAIAVQPTLFFSNPVSLNDASIIANGFSESFKLAKIIESGQLSSTIWLPAATAIVSFWSGTSFSPLVPPPGGLIGATNMIVSAGLPTPLNEDIAVAFSQDSASSSAEKLNTAFTNHLLSITGIWIGTSPGSPPPPFSFPWNGLQ